MRRRARLDAPGSLHHVTVRRLERCAMPHEWTYGPLFDNLPSGDRAR